MIIPKIIFIHNLPQQLQKLLLHLCVTKPYATNSHFYMATQWGKQIHLRYPRHMWELLDKIIADEGFSDFNSFIKKELSSMHRNSTLTECNGGSGMESRLISIPFFQTKKIDLISCTHQMAPGKLVSNYIIYPRLGKHYEEEGF